MKELEKSYEPKGVEEKWYERWLTEGYFTAAPASQSAPYSIVIPPPNVTGSLHMGHALNATLQDVLARRKRMQGLDVLWVPGMDHAGIATQNVVERQIAKDGLDRHAMGREAFTDRVWKWKAESGGMIIHQLKRIGASCDWTRERFTLDEGLSEAVREVFVSLYEQGLIYRDNRLINWCPRCHTALSDIEVEHEEIDGRLTHIKYPLEDGSGHVVVATTRPETMLGDTAVAVHPEDERYSAFIGKMIALPLTGRKIPVVSDPAVDPEFGTGAVKVTPAHDFNDEAIAKRQNPQLPFLTVIAPDGTMTREAGEKYAGMDRYACRTAVVKDLEAAGLLEKQDVHKHAVGNCYRCKTVIEPLSALQWYVKIKPLAEKAIDAVRSGEIRIIPRSWENTYFSWMENINDWCISRQIWWGHRIPAWYCRGLGNDECRSKRGVIVSRKTPAACPYCGSKDLAQEEDVLDTWFSSALWPFSTLGWPHKTAELEKYYPTSVLVTGFDIIFFWVARMIMMGIKFMDDIPFRDVYIHALVRDASGQKMSKSKGNVIDPLIMMEKYGTDAFRFTLAAFAAQGRDIKFSEERVEGYRHFVNKLWNASRFILMNAGDAVVPVNMNPAELDLADRWILSRLSHAAAETNVALDEYRFNDASGAIYHFIWHELCDWYIEMIKPALYGDSPEKSKTRECMIYVLENTLRLLHPFMPFVTEEIRGHIPRSGSGLEDASIVNAAYPQAFYADEATEAEMTVLMETVMAVRTIRGELNISPSKELRVFVRTLDEAGLRAITGQKAYIEKLARAVIVEAAPELAKPKGSAAAVRSFAEIYVPLEGLLNIDLELDRLRKEESRLEETIAFLGGKLGNEDFLKRAPAGIVQKEKEKHEECIEKRDRIRENIRKLSEAGGQS